MLILKLEGGLLVCMPACLVWAHDYYNTINHVWSVLLKAKAAFKAHPMRLILRATVHHVKP
jgi:hypothetical protein